MPIKSNLKSLTPRREAYKHEYTLLSKGAGNRLAWPGGKIMIYPWDSSVDDLVINGSRGSGGPRNLLFDILERVADMKNATDDFFADEVNTILLTSRALANDGVLQYTSSCPLCGYKATETITVPADLEPVAEKPENWPGFDQIILPKSGDHVRIRPLQIKDEKIIMQRTPAQKKIISDTILRVLMHIQAISTDGTEWNEPSTVEELVVWYNAIHPKDAKELEEKEKANTPHANTLIPHTCDGCGRAFTHLLTFDADFFR